MISGLHKLHVTQAACCLWLADALGFWLGLLGLGLGLRHVMR